jgi:putative glutamine amidotransferase
MNRNQPPLIGITTYARDEGNKVTLPSEYIDAVRRAGGCAVLLPPGERNLDIVLARLDGLIIAGGGDIDPARYGGDHHTAVYMIDTERDEMELELARRVIDSGMPTLCICRGSQILNVALGGTLHVHLPDVVGEQVHHRAPPREPTPHPVQIDDQSRLAELIGRTEREPMSWHHQAICNVAPQLQVVARAPDDVVEAIEYPDHPWLIGVQWHPELTAADDPAQQNLFDGLVRAAGTIE